jgi:RuvB-like protein 2
MFHCLSPSLVPVQLICVRAEEEDVKLSPEALDLLAHMGTVTSLRYALNLIAPAQLLALRRKSANVEIEDVRLAYKYFCDVERSTTYAKETSGMMFGEEEVGAPTMVNGNGVHGVAMDLS